MKMKIFEIERKVHKQGYLARCRKQPVSTCPYHSLSSFRSNWVAGWLTAEYR